jgi:hypothetical protein
MSHGFLPSNTPQLPGPPPGSTSSVQYSWGNNSGKILNKWRDKAIVFDLKHSVRIRTGDEAWTAVTEALTPLQICSNQGFAYYKWDAKYDIGVYRRSGSWAHSMQIIAAFDIKDQRFAVVRNQWGRKAHKNCGHGVPLGSFVIYWETFEAWLQNAYCATIGEVQGKQVARWYKALQKGVIT